MSSIILTTWGFSAGTYNACDYGYFDKA